MRKLLMFSALLLIGLSFTSCTWIKCQTNVDDIVAKVKQKNDPQNKAKTVKTAIFKYRCINGLEKSRLTILLKRPDKIKIMSRFGKEFWQCAFNGKKAWEYSNAGGVRLLSGAEANEVRLQAFLLAPSIDIKKVFKSIKIDSSEKIAGQDCWKLICQPKDGFKSQAITVFVTKKTDLIVKVIEKHDEAKALITVVTCFKNYKMFKGFLLPTKTITEIDGDMTESTLVGIALNQNIPDSVFTAPKTFK
ncbi:MAG: outer membrane lipoprotein-sorting protein [Victivallales bacterium]|nr:outer membrane lipoprotein-sorting protein [Victivallales bacterium]